MMMPKNVTWQQVAVLAICLGFAFASHKFLGESAGMAAGLMTSIIAFVMGRPRSDDDPAT